MGGPTTGATWADAIIAAIEFAKEHPFRFLLTVPLTLGLLFAMMVLALRVGLLGPVTGFRNQYERKRADAKNAKEPRLPL
jgi:hypothetical protein